MGIVDLPPNLTQTEQQRRVMNALQEATSKLAAFRQQHSEPIAVVGMGCRFPGAPELDKFWNLLISSASAIEDVPADRWNRDAFHASTPKEAGKVTCQHAGYIRDVESFDARFFEITQREGRGWIPSNVCCSRQRGSLWNTREFNRRA